MAKKYDLTKAEMAQVGENLLDAMATLIAMGGMASEQWQGGNPVPWGVYGETESKVVSLDGQGNKQHHLMGITVPLAVVAHLQKAAMAAVEAGMEKPDNPEVIPALPGGPIIMKLGQPPAAGDGNAN